MKSVYCFIPTFLTLFRLINAIIILPLLLATFLPTATVTIHNLLASFFLLVSFTDFLDGYLARYFKCESSLGALLDPVADKFLIFSTLIIFVALHKIYFYWAFIFIAREFWLMALRMIASHYDFNVPVSQWGKYKTAMQVIYCFLVIGNYANTMHSLQWLEGAMLYMALGLSLVSAWWYTQHFFITWRKVL